jgi:hypothetical protein
MKKIERCPNCKTCFTKEKDRTYSFKLTHRNSLCPYRFEAAAHTKNQLQTNIQGIFKSYGII